MSKRGVIYIYWGDKVLPELNRSIESLHKHHPELPYKAISIDPTSSLLDKAKMLEVSPFETTLFLDTDTVVMDRLDFGFEKAEQFGLACCINECPWARRYTDIGGDQIEYNTGVLFFTKKAKPVFDAWAKLAPEVQSSIVLHIDGKVDKMPYNDQASFSQAIMETSFLPFVLPLNWNLRINWHKSLFGPIKVWHDRSEVPPYLKFWNEEQTHPGAIIRYTEIKQLP